MHVEPPISACFSSTTALAPASAAVRAATIPPPPDPTITKSNAASQVVMSRPRSPPNDVLRTRAKVPERVDDCYEPEVIFGVEARGDMSGSSRTLTYPAEGVGAPKDRRPKPLVDV